MPRKAHLLRLAEAKRNQLKQSITVYGTVYRFEFRVLRSLFILTELLYNEWHESLLSDNVKIINWLKIVGEEYSVDKTPKNPNYFSYSTPPYPFIISVSFSQPLLRKGIEPDGFGFVIYRTDKSY